ncbi:hypothetical protein AB0C74_18570 [Spirillospora sp. NPDC048832]
MKISRAAQEAYEAEVEKWARRRNCSFKEAATWLCDEEIIGFPQKNTPPHPPPNDHPGWEAVGGNGMPPHWSFSFGRGEVASKALEELKQKGRDDKRRRFNGRILIEIRCKGKGHFLGAVYPTKWGHLLVQSVRGPRPHWKPASAARKEAEQSFRDMGLQIECDTGRDSWYHELEDHSKAQGGRQSLIETFDYSLVDWPRDPNIPVAYRMFCRCGLRISPPPWVLAEVADEARLTGKTEKVFC